MVDKNWIGKNTSQLKVKVEEGQLRFFAKAVGETNPVYTDEAAAQAAGYRSLPAPPTFLFSLNLAHPDPLARYIEMGIDLARLLHGNQQFDYFLPICAGDRIRLESTVVDIFTKKNGALEFVVEETTATNQMDELVGKSTQTLVIRHS